MYGAKRFYPDFDVDTLNEDVDFLDGRTFIGKTLHLKSDKFAFPIEQYSDVDVPPTEFTLKVVGVYDIKRLPLHRVIYLFPTIQEFCLTNCVWNTSNKKIQLDIRR